MPETTPAVDAGLDAVCAVRALARASRVLERASGELSLAHYRVLSALSSGEERASRVAANLAVGRPAVSAAVESLARRGLLSRMSAETDQRVDVLTLTAEGEALLARVEVEMVRRMRELCARTPDAAQVLESLGWLGAAIDAAVAERARSRGGSR
jgi:DNA-binding MarR family transcriptional regulator